MGPWRRVAPSYDESRRVHPVIYRTTGASPVRRRAPMLTRAAHVVRSTIATTARPCSLIPTTVRPEPAARCEARAARRRATTGPVRHWASMRALWIDHFLSPPGAASCRFCGRRPSMIRARPAPGAVVARRRRRAGPAPSAEAADVARTASPVVERRREHGRGCWRSSRALARGRRLGDDDGPQLGGRRGRGGAEESREGIRWRRRSSSWGGAGGGAAMTSDAELVPTSTWGRAITRSPCRPGAGARMSAAEERATLRRQRATTRTSRDSSIFGADQLDVVRVGFVREMANPTEIGGETRVVALCATILVAGMSPSSRGSNRRTRRIAEGRETT